MWTCPKCRSKVDPSFEVCWSCGTSRAGDEDQGFVRADDAGPIVDPPTDAKPAAGDELTHDLAPAAVALVECYWAGDSYEAQFIADELIQKGIPATADRQDLRYWIAGLFPSGPYFAPRVRVLAEDLPRARTWLETYERRRHALMRPRRMRGIAKRSGAASGRPDGSRATGPLRSATVPAAQ
jgi:hypothetical protein